MSTRFFSDAEIKRLRSWPEELGRDELIRHFTLGSDDRAWLESAARGTGNRLGMAIQLCTLPWLGFVPDDVAAVPAAAANRIAVQLGVPIADLAGYGSRKQTRTEHLRTVAARLGWRTAGRTEWKDLEEFLLARAIEHDAPSVLFRLRSSTLAGAGAGVRRTGWGSRSRCARCRGWGSCRTTWPWPRGRRWCGWPSSSRSIRMRSARTGVERRPGPNIFGWRRSTWGGGRRRRWS